MGYHLNQKERFSLKSGKIQILMKMTTFDLFSVYILKNTKFSIEMPYRLVSLLEKLQISSKILNFRENEEIIKFLSRILSRSVIFTEKFPIFMFSSRILYFGKKIMKISNFPLKGPTVWSPCLKNYVFFTVLLKNYSFQGKS